MYEISSSRVLHTLPLRYQSHYAKEQPDDGLEKEAETCRCNNTVHKYILCCVLTDIIQ